VLQDPVFDRRGHLILRELEGDDGLHALAGHRQREAVRQRRGLAERAAFLELLRRPILRHRVGEERIEIRRRNADCRLRRLGLEVTVAAFGLVEARDKDGFWPMDPRGVLRGRGGCREHCRESSEYRSQEISLPVAQDVGGVAD
jgi:hypothetical protein